VIDLAKFSRALRLRWLWQEWTTVDKPWVGTAVPCNETDRLLFNASTVIHVGNGNKTRFWHHSWLDGEAPKNLAPHLFQLVRRKNKTVQQELTNDAWIETLRGEISTATQLQEFVSLWVCIQDVNLQPDLDDQIIWKWTNDGIYSNRSAYRAQFYGTYRTYKTDIIWRARAENKCKLFVWILIQNKILTADNLAIRGWPHQDACILCNGPLETGHHLCLDCPFAQATWSIVTSWEGINLQPALQTPSNSLADWWESALFSIPREKRRDFNGMTIYIM
jgi:hypothetical protein